jgi:AcrR family transcriptional regulator
MNKRHKAIVEHSLALFRKKGIRNTSVQDIIDRAGISKGTFYNYFSSKNECVSALLEQIRYEASLSRSELLIGKDAKDLDLLIEQITILTKLNEKHGMNAIYEEIFYSGEQELKQMVLKYRIAELEWLAERLIEVYGEPLRPYAFEGAVIFYGLLQHLLFTHKLTNILSFDTKSVASSVFHYMKYIIHALIHEQTAVLEPDQLVTLKDNLKTSPITKKDVIDMLRELLTESSDLTRGQQDLTQALLSELEQTDLREAVLIALLKPFAEAFEDTADAKLAKKISTMVWHYLKQIK